MRRKLGRAWYAGLFPGFKPSDGQCNFLYVNETDGTILFGGRQSASVASSKDGLQKESKELGHERHRRRKKSNSSRGARVDCNCFVRSVAASEGNEVSCTKKSGRATESRRMAFDR